MNAIATPLADDRRLLETEWGPARHNIARSAADEITLDRRDAALAWSEDN